MTRAILIASPNLSLDRTIEVRSISVGHVHRSITSDARGGGKGVNVARALACMGWRSTVVGLSAGRTGGAVTGMLADERITTIAVPAGGETRSCLTVLSDNDVTVFNESGPTLEREHWDSFEAAVVDRLTRDTVLVCSGSFPPGAPDDGAARLISAAHRIGCISICDTSRTQLTHALGAGPDVIAPNLAEALGVLEGTEREPVDMGAGALDTAGEAAAALAARGPSAVVVTAGAAGAVSRIGGDTRRWLPHAVALRNPVGAGDCFIAGLALGMSRAEDLVAAARRGFAMAAAGCETFAAGALEAGRVEELMESSRRHPGA
ncbi:MAG: 1-phosphofructokinase family hexose kinase [Actinomycetota bacterium]